AAHLAGAPQRIDEIQREDERQHAAEHPQHRRGEATGEIAPERAEHHRRALTRASAREAGPTKIASSDSATTATGPPQAPIIDHSGAAAEPLPRSTSASAKPKMRTAANTATAARMARPRFCRVVRASPSAAKATRPATSA